MEAASNQFLFNERIFLQSTSDVDRTEMLRSMNSLCKTMSQIDICCVVEETSIFCSHDRTARDIHWHVVELLLEVSCVSLLGLSKALKRF